MSFGVLKFRRRYDVGRKYEEMVYEKLVKEGIPCDLSEYTPPAPGVDASKFTKESKDITIGDDIVIEVKSRGGTCSFFTGPNDFPYDTVIIDTVYGWKQKTVKPAYYVIVAQETGGIMVLDGSTNEQWLEQDVYDRYEGKKNLSYMVPADLFFTWEKFVEAVRGELEPIQDEGRDGSGRGEFLQGKPEAGGDGVGTRSVPL